MVESINQLSQRYRAAVARERELAGELAHEMRTPLASLALHAQALGGALTTPIGASAGACRARRPARRPGAAAPADPGARRPHRLVEARTRFDLVPMAARVLADSRPGRARRPPRAGADGGDRRCTCSGHEVLLELALRNLVENALAHAPPGTVVDVKVDAGALARGQRRMGAPCHAAAGAAAPAAALARARARPPRGREGRRAARRRVAEEAEPANDSAPTHGTASASGRGSTCTLDRLSDASSYGPPEAMAGPVRPSTRPDRQRGVLAGAPPGATLHHRPDRPPAPTSLRTRPRTPVASTDADRRRGLAGMAASAAPAHCRRWRR